MGSYHTQEVCKESCREKCQREASLATRSLLLLALGLSADSSIATSTNQAVQYDIVIHEPEFQNRAHSWGQDWFGSAQNEKRRAGQLVPSFFMAYAPDTQKETRKQHLQVCIALLQVLQLSGLISEAHATREIQTLQSVLVSLEKSDDNDLPQDAFQYTTRRAFSEGYFAGSKDRIFSLSKYLDIGYLECMRLRDSLGRG